MSVVEKLEPDQAMVDVLGEALDLADRPPDDHEGPWKIDGPRSADWAMRKYARTQAKLAEVKETAQSQVEAILAAAQVHIGPIQAWADAEIEAAEKDLSFWEMHLTDYHRELREADDKVTSFSLPHGTLRSRKTPDTITVDPDAFVPWASVSRPDLLVAEPQPVDKATLKKALEPGDTVEDPGVPAIDPQTGEMVPGVFLLQG